MTILPQLFQDYTNVYDFFQLEKTVNDFMYPITSFSEPIEYADFTIDKSPIFDKEESIQLSFDDLIRNSLEDGRPIAPFNHRSDKPFFF